ncbi:zinc finger protein 638 isoform X2 [Xenopus laevis]|uniref:Zinc finger protein 638 isoform X2 n=1 Tax=Xenopus laevis TaxID=8355 RepID=A0A8J1M0R5_XENLA|nr:zinc finger protein 638 isoform X2 [Xenopus laevis]
MFNPRGGFPVQRQQQPGHPLLNQANMNHPGMNLPGLNHPGMNLPSMNNPSLTHPGMGPSGMNHPVMAHSGINQSGMNFNRMAHPGMNQGGMNQGGMNQGGMNQGGMNQGGMNQGGMNQGGMNQGGMNQGGMNQGSMGFHSEIKGPGFGIRPHGMDPPGQFLGRAPEPMGMKGMPPRAPMHGTPERALGPQAYPQQRFGGPSTSVRPGPQRMQSQNPDVAPGMNLLMKQSPSDLLLGKDIPLHESSRHLGNEKQWEPRGTFGNIPPSTGMKQMPSSQISDHHKRYTTESASSILESFGLSNEDLEELSRYPDDQLTPSNMPVILRDIRMRKIGRPGAPDHSGGRRPTSDVLPSKVIDYGHSSKYQFKEESVPIRNFDSSRKDGKDFKPAATPKRMDSQKVNPPNKPASSVKKQPEKPTSNLMDNKIPTISVTRQNQRPAKQDRPQSTNIVVEQPVVQSTLKSEVPNVEHPPALTANQPEVPAIGHSDTQVASYTEARADHIPTLVNRGNYQPPPDPPGDAARFPPKWSPGLSLPETEKMKRLPTPSMMNDYYAASPRIFPHICSLCNLQCRVLKDWIKHQNTQGHIESCRQLRLRFPDWNPHELAPLRDDDKDKSDGSSKRSKSRSNSPRRSRRSGSGHRARRSRSRSPRLAGRVRTRSRSPKRPVRSPRRSRSPHRRSRSPRRSSSPRRTRRPRSSRSGSTSPDKRAVDAAVRNFIDRTDQKTGQNKNNPSKAPSDGKRPLQGSSSNSLRTKKPPASSSAKKPDFSSSTSKKPSGASSTSYPKKNSSSTEKKPTNSRSSSQEKKSGSSSSTAKKPVVSTAARKTSASAVAGKKPLQSKYSGAAKNARGPTKPGPPKEPHTPLLKFKNKSNPGTVIHVTNLPDSGYSDQDILKIVQPFGKVCDILIIRSKNEAFLETNFKEAAAAAVKFSETTPVMINNTRINLCLAGQKVESGKNEATPASADDIPVETAQAPVNTAKPETKTIKAETKTKPKLDSKKGSAAAGKAKVPDVIPPGFVKCYKLTEPPMKDAEKCVVLISNLPEEPITVEELSNLAKPFGGVNDIIIISTHRKALLELSSKNSVDSMIRFYNVFPSNIGGKVLSISLAPKFKDLKDEERIFAYIIEQSPCKITPSIYEKFVYLVDLPEKGYTEFSVVCVGLRFGKVDHYAIFSNKRKAILHMCSTSAVKTMHSFLTQYPCTIGENTVKCVLPSKKKLSEDEYEVVVEEEKACSETESNVDETEEAQTADEIALKAQATNNADSAADDKVVSTSIPVVAVNEPVVECLEEQSSTIEEESVSVAEQPSAVDEESPAVVEEAHMPVEEDTHLENEATPLSNKEETCLANKEDVTLTIKEEISLTAKNETDQVNKEANEEEIYTIPNEEAPTFENETKLAIDESEVQQDVQDTSEAKLEDLPTSENPDSFKEAVAQPEPTRTFADSAFLSLSFGVQATEDDDEEEEAAEAPDLDVTSPISSTATDPMDEDDQPVIHAKPHIHEDSDVMVSVESECEEDEMSEEVILKDHVQKFQEPEASMVELVTASEETEEPETDYASVAPEIFSDSPSHIGHTQSEPSEFHAKISEKCVTHEPEHENKLIEKLTDTLSKSVEQETMDMEKSSLNNSETQETSFKSSKGDHSHGKDKDSSMGKSSSGKQTSTSRVKSASEKSRDSSSATKESLYKRNSRSAKFNPQKGELSVTVTLDSQKGSKMDTRKKLSAERGSSGRESSTPKSNSNRSSPSESSNNHKSSAGSSQKKGGSRSVSSGSDKESKVTPRSWERGTRSSNKKDDRFRDDRSREDRSRDYRSKEERPREDRSKEGRPKENRPRDDRPKEDRPRDDRSKEDRPRDEHPKEDRPRDDRPKEDRPRDDRPKEDRPRDDRPKEDRPRDDRPKEDRPRDDRPKEDRPRDDRPKEDRPRDDRPKEDRPRDDRPKEDRPRDDRPKEDRPRDDRPKEDHPLDERPKEDRFKSSLTKQQRSSRSASRGKKSGKEQEDMFPFNLDEFVTVDEIVEEHGDAKKAEEQTDASELLNTSRKGKRKDNEPSPVEAKKAKGRSPDPHLTKQDCSYVTLDEIVDEEDGTVGSDPSDPLGLAKESQSLLTVDEVHAEDDQPSAKDPQGLMTLDEISGEEDGTRYSATAHAPLEIPEVFGKEQLLLTLDEIGGEEEEPISSESSSLQATNPKDEENKAELNDLDDKEINLFKILDDSQVEDQVPVDPKEQPLLTLDEVKGDDDTESLVDISFSEGNQFFTVDEIGEEEEDSTVVSEMNIESGGRGKGKTGIKATNTKPTPKRGRPRKRPFPKDRTAGPSDSSKNKKDKKETQDSAEDPSQGTSAAKSPVESKASKESPGKGKSTGSLGAEKADSEKAAASTADSEETAPETKKPKLAPYNPSVPIGIEFLIPQTGFFCELCSLFYINEATKIKHCKSLRHYQSVERHRLGIVWNSY